MKQLLQNLKTGEGLVADVPAPVAQPGRVLVRAAASLVSAGTERAFVELGRKSLLGKAKDRPDLVGKVLEKVKSEGLLSTLRSVREKLDESHALGYSAAGLVVEVGEGVTEFRAGDRVACAGTGYAAHAELLSVPKNLCVRLPDGVDFETGAFATLGAIALQGVRLAEPTLGESVVVIGLGLIGQLAAQLLKANGCRVFGVDLDESKVELARRLGADDGCVAGEGVKGAVLKWSRGRGADAVLITAATQSNGPVELAGEISRLRGRVVAVGLVGMNVPRQIYFQRELTLRVSMSYGPGRYDPEYEERGHDYPLPYVRWTEKRNIESFVELIAERRLNVERLTTHRFPIAEADRAYQLISGELQERNLGVVLNYDPEAEVVRRVSLGARVRKSEKSIVLGVIGAGGYVPAMLLPHFKTEGVEFRSIATASGVSAHDVGKRFGFAFAVSSGQEVLDDAGVNLVVIGTRNNTHAELARGALERNKHVFVEKPLAVNDEQLESVLEAAASSSGKLMVGFNRRFAPLTQRAKEFFRNRDTPLSMLYRVNAGRIPKEHWMQDAEEGAGRIIGEACHFIDLMQYFAGAPPVYVFAESISARSSKIVDADSVIITLRFADGSNGSLAYLAEGDKGLAKERVEIFGEGRVFVLDDFRRAMLYKDGREEQIASKTQDKGQQEQVRAVCASVLQGGAPPISLDELAATTRATFRVLDSLRDRRPFEI